MRMKLSRNYYFVSLIVVVCSLVVLYYYFQFMQPRPMYFTVQVTDETFVMYVTDLETVELALDNLKGKNSKIPFGELGAGDGGFNEPWSWHLVPDTVRMVDFSIEIYDGRPSFVEDELDYWLGSIGFYCPWGGKVVSADRAPP